MTHFGSANKINQSSWDLWFHSTLNLVHQYSICSTQHFGVKMFSSLILFPHTQKNRLIAESGGTRVAQGMCGKTPLSRSIATWFGDQSKKKNELILETDLRLQRAQTHHFCRDLACNQEGLRGE
jgi:hypothetical protein